MATVMMFIGFIAFVVGVIKFSIDWLDPSADKWFVAGGVITFFSVLLEML